MGGGATLRANKLDAFFTVAIPMATPGFVMAAMLGFAHTVGGFGSVLLIGGTITHKTRVGWTRNLGHGEAKEKGQGHGLAGSK